MENTCSNCKHHGKSNFCDKLVVDTKRITFEGKGLQAYYVAEREDYDFENDDHQDERFAFMTHNTFSCKFHEIKDK